MADLRRYFDDIQPGEEYESPGRTVTETDIVIFAGLSGDYNVTRATQAYATLAFAGLRWKFKGPIKIGDTIKLRAKVIAKKETGKPDRGLITLERTVLNQRGEVVQEGETDLIVERRP